MEFKNSNLKSVDFRNLIEGQVANATLKSFNFRGDYVFATFVAEDETINTIIGNKSDYKLSDLLPLKGVEVEIIFTGTRTVNGVTYPKYYVNW